MLADRGWAFDDRPTGLFDHLREPDATAIKFGVLPPLRTMIFEEIDHRVGWYTGHSADEAGLGHLELLRYDNSGNASAKYDGTYAWHADFWGAGYKQQFGEFSLLVQGLTGETIITPFPHFSSVTDYGAAYVLLGGEWDNWRLAARADVFDTRQHNPGAPLRLSEHGEALTLAANWLPYEWLRLSAELLCVDNTRDERTITGLDPHQVNTQLQLGARVYI